MISFHICKSSAVLNTAKFRLIVCHGRSNLDLLSSENIPAITDEVFSVGHGVTFEKSSAHDAREQDVDDFQVEFNDSGRTP